MANDDAPAWVAPYRAARAAGELSYRDPETGYSVFTEEGLRTRGSCCGCGCRHCPWAHEAVAIETRAQRIKRPAMLVGERPVGRTAVLFYSGGKDSYLALRALRRQHPELEPVLLTTFDVVRRIVAHQELPIARVVEQARALEVPLLGVPLVREGDYVATVTEALDVLAAEARLEVFAFGDLHLDHIRCWREEALAELAARHHAAMAFPLWQAGYDGLFDDLEQSGVSVRICAAPDPEAIAPLTIGDAYDRASAARLPATTDRFGEAGEFHTEVIPSSLAPI